MERTQDGHPLKLLPVVDEYTRECLVMAVPRQMRATEVQEVVRQLFLTHGCPTHIRSDNSSEFIATALRARYRLLGVAPLFVEPGSPWENGYVESFNGKLRDESLNGALFDTLQEAQVLVERWRRRYNTQRPHRAFGYRPPAPEARGLTQQAASILGTGQGRAGTRPCQSLAIGRVWKIFSVDSLSSDS